MDQNLLLVACIPAFNEEKTIARVVLLAQKCVDRVIVCDDGSTDVTGEIAGRLGAEVMRHERLMGYGRRSGLCSGGLGSWNYSCEITVK